MFNMDNGARTLSTIGRQRHSNPDRLSGVPKIPTRFGMAQQVFKKALSYNTSDPMLEKYNTLKQRHQQQQTANSSADCNNNTLSKPNKRTVVIIKGRRRAQSSSLDDKFGSKIAEVANEKDNRTDVNASAVLKHSNNGNDIQSGKERRVARDRLSLQSIVLDPFVRNQDASQNRVKVRNCQDFHIRCQVCVPSKLTFLQIEIPLLKIKYSPIFVHDCRPMFFILPVVLSECFNYPGIRVNLRRHCTCLGFTRSVDVPCSVGVRLIMDNGLCIIGSSTKWKSPKFR